jgi:hypothetical protein
MSEQPNVMGALKAEKTGEGSNKSFEEIIREDSSRQGQNPEQVFKKIAGMKKQNPQTKTIQIGSTVFIVTQVAPKTVEAHIFTSEPPKVIAQRYVSLVNMLKSQGMSKGYTYSDQPGFKKIAEMTGLPVKVTQTVKLMGEEIKPVYMFELDF